MQDPILLTKISRILTEETEEPKKAAKESVLYLYRPGADYQCNECALWISNERCLLHGVDDVIKGVGSCGYWVKGKPRTSGSPLETVSKTQSGYMENQPGFSCKRCEYFGGAEKRQCLKVDENSTGDTPGEIHEDACCNAWEKK